jgi:hypothetical protein
MSKQPNNFITLQDTSRYTIITMSYLCNTEQGSKRARYYALKMLCMKESRFFE